MLQRKRSDEAEADFQQALIYGRYSTDVLDGLGYIDANVRHDLIKASEVYRELTTLDSRRSRWLYQYGFMLLRANDCRAVEVLDRYLAQCAAGAYCGAEDDGWEPNAPDALKFMLKGLQSRNSCPRVRDGCVRWRSSP